jgi:hypothetical protein
MRVYVDSVQATVPTHIRHMRVYCFACPGNRAKACPDNRADTQGMHMYTRTAMTVSATGQTHLKHTYVNSGDCPGDNRETHQAYACILLCLSW